MEQKNDLAIGYNTIDILIKKKKRNIISKVIYFTCKKKNYYASNYNKPKNNFSLSNLRISK